MSGTALMNVSKIKEFNRNRFPKLFHIFMIHFFHVEAGKFKNILFNMVESTDSLTMSIQGYVVKFCLVKYVTEK